MLETLFIPTREAVDMQGEGFKYFQNIDYTRDGVHVTQDNQLNFDTVYACINVLSDDIAKLPFKTYKKDKDGSIMQVRDNDIHRVIRVRPNQQMSPFTFNKLIMTDVLMHGNAYIFISRDKDGQIKELIPLTSTLTHPVMHKGKLYYVTKYDGKDISLHSDEVAHIKGMSRDGITGMSPIQAMRMQLESNAEATKYNRDMIKKDGVPRGVLTVDASLKKEAKEALRDSWESANQGHSVAIADNGIKYQQMGLAQEDMQWLESQKYNVQRIASIFKVPLHKINDLENATYTNIEHQSLDYVKNTLQPWITQMEFEFGYKMYTESEALDGYYVKFNMDSELRGDSEARAKVKEINFRNGFKVLTEVRSSNEDSPFLEDFASKPFMTLNYAPMENITAFNNNNHGNAVNNIQKGDDDNTDEE